MVEPGEGFHVVGALKGSWLLHLLLAHNTQHLMHRGIFVFVHPVGEFVQKYFSTGDAFLHQFRSDHHRTRTCHDGFDHILTIMNPNSEGEIHRDAAIEDGNPTQGQEQFSGGAQFQFRIDLQHRKVQLGSQEVVEYQSLQTCW